jgi:hypothetical protein
MATAQDGRRQRRRCKMEGAGAASGWAQVVGGRAKSRGVAPGSQEPRTRRTWHWRERYRETTRAAWGGSWAGRDQGWDWESRNSGVRVCNVHNDKWGQKALAGPLVRGYGFATSRLASARLDGSELSPISKTADFFLNQTFPDLMQVPVGFAGVGYALPSDQWFHFFFVIFDQILFKYSDLRAELSKHLLSHVATNLWVLFIRNNVKLTKSL